MKSLKIFSTAVLVMLFAQLSFAQKTTTESINVSGNCGMCKKKIEKAAKDAGATSAVWSTQTKVLTVRYNSLSTNSAKIQQKIANVGYDTPDFKATDEAYNKLDACCQYDRTMSKDEKCCSDGCEMKDGKCADEAACKEKGCCKDSEKCKAMGCCGNETAGNGKMADCCKKGTDGKMAMNCGSETSCKGKMDDCCKKSTTGKATVNSAGNNKSNSTKRAQQ